MPGSVANAAPTTVMPAALCRLFRASRQYPAQINVYRDGSRQVALRGATSRKTWDLTLRVAAAEIEDLYDFWLARISGGSEPFYFYDLLDDKQATHDPTGEDPVGRFTVRFASGWSQTSGMARTEIPVSLIEVA